MLNGLPQTNRWTPIGVKVPLTVLPRPYSGQDHPTSRRIEDAGVRGAGGRCVPRGASWNAFLLPEPCALPGLHIFSIATRLASGREAKRQPVLLFSVAHRGRK